MSDDLIRHFGSQHTAAIARLDASNVSDALPAVSPGVKPEVAALVEALRFYAWENEMRLPSDGPWGAGSTDFGKVARATLAEIKGGNDAESNL